jgi:deoxyribodipyrimidine photo-lyase
MTDAIIVWFRQDLRLRDNDALSAAARCGAPLVPLYIWSPEEEGDWPPGAASRWWLHHSLTRLEGALRERGLRLTLRRGPTLAVLDELVRERRARALYFNLRYEPAAQEVQRRVETTFGARGIEVRGFNGSLLLDPRSTLNQSGRPYQVYTPFLRNLLRSARPAAPAPIPRNLKGLAHWPKTLPIAALGLLPKIRWYETMAATWQPGEAGAQVRMRRFLRAHLARYKAVRDEPASAGTSGLSPHLHLGEIGPRQIWHALGAGGRSSPFLRELVWREFAYHLLHHFPQTPSAPLRREFEQFAWRNAKADLRAWQHGETGVPLVDAGMRELWATGFMHNRVRMVAASFLVKNLRLPWQQGARWFWDTLVDADLANNTLNWQWVAGCGADAAPYFRIFNPVSQGERFDADARYVRRWVPQLAGLPSRRAHSPWIGGPLPAGYPSPIVDLAASREAALEAYQSLRARRSSLRP